MNFLSVCNYSESAINSQVSAKGNVQFAIKLQRKQQEK